MSGVHEKALSPARGTFSENGDKPSRIAHSSPKGEGEAQACERLLSITILYNLENNMPIVTNPKGGIELEVFWSDEDLIQCQVRCSNGRFSGITEIYLSHPDLPRVASALKGFPYNGADLRELELGTFDPAHADGGIRLRCYCRDSAAHAEVEVTLWGDAARALVNRSLSP